MRGDAGRPHCRRTLCESETVRQYLLETLQPRSRWSKVIHEERKGEREKERPKALPVDRAIKNY